MSSTTPGANTHTRQDVWDEIEKSAEVSNGCVADGATPCTWQAWFVGASGPGQSTWAKSPNPRPPCRPTRSAFGWR